MKKILLIASVAVIFLACKSKTKTDLETNRNMVMVDTTGLSSSNGSTDVGKDVVPGNNNTTSKKNQPGSNNAGNNNNNPTPNNPANNNGTSTNGSASPSNSGVAAPADKGWSDAAKGTAIGGGSGAVLGAVVSKDKGKGAIIGGVIGAGAGYIIGRSKDKKSGRVARQKARRRARKA